MVWLLPSYRADWWVHSSIEYLHYTEYLISQGLCDTSYPGRGHALSVFCQLVLSLLLRPDLRTGGSMSLTLASKLLSPSPWSPHLSRSNVSLPCVTVSLLDFASQLILLDCSFLHHPSEFAFWPGVLLPKVCLHIRHFPQQVIPPLIFSDGHHTERRARRELIPTYLMIPFIYSQIDTQ